MERVGRTSEKTTLWTEEPVSVTVVYFDDNKSIYVPTNRFRKN